MNSYSSSAANFPHDNFSVMGHDFPLPIKRRLDSDSSNMSGEHSKWIMSLEHFEYEKCLMLQYYLQRKEKKSRLLWNKFKVCCSLLSPRLRLVISYHLSHLPWAVSTRQKPMKLPEVEFQWAGNGLDVPVTALEIHVPWTFWILMRERM